MVPSPYTASLGRGCPYRELVPSIVLYFCEKQDALSGQHYLVPGCVNAGAQQMTKEDADLEGNCRHGQEIASVKELPLLTQQRQIKLETERKSKNKTKKISDMCTQLNQRHVS